MARQELLKQHQAFLAGSGIDYMRGSAGPETPPSLAPPGRAAKVEEAVAAAEAAEEALRAPPPPGLSAPSKNANSTEEEVRADLPTISEDHLQLVPNQQHP